MVREYDAHHLHVAETYDRDALARGDHDEWTKLYTTTHRLATAFVCRYAPHQDVEDTVQRLFGDLWEKRESFTVIDNVPGYVAKCALFDALTVRNRAIRQEQRTTHFAQSFDEDDPGTIAIDRFSYGSVTPEEEAIAELDHEIKQSNTTKVIEALNTQCSPREQDVLHLRLAGYDRQEIAKELGVSVSAVENFIYTAYKKIRGHLGIQKNVTSSEELLPSPIQEQVGKFKFNTPTHPDTIDQTSRMPNRRLNYRLALAIQQGKASDVYQLLEEGEEALRDSLSLPLTELNAFSRVARAYFASPIAPNNEHRIAQEDYLSYLLGAHLYATYGSVRGHEILLHFFPKLSSSASPIALSTWFNPEGTTGILPSTASIVHNYIERAPGEVNEGTANQFIENGLGALIASCITHIGKRSQGFAGSGITNEKVTNRFTITGEAAKSISERLGKALVENGIACLSENADGQIITIKNLYIAKILQFIKHGNRYRTLSTLPNSVQNELVAIFLDESEDKYTYDKSEDLIHIQTPIGSERSELMEWLVETLDSRRCGRLVQFYNNSNFTVLRVFKKDIAEIKRLLEEDNRFSQPDHRSAFQIVEDILAANGQ